VREYYIVKRYNPAYHYFEANYLKEGGFDVEGLTWQRARYKYSLLAERKEENLTNYNSVFSAYARAWTSLHPLRPALYNVFWHIFGGEPSIRKLKEIEPQLPPGQGKLLFSPEEIAEEVSGFYRKYIRDPLKNDLEQQANERKILSYLTSNEIDRGLRLKEPAKAEEEHQKAARELLSWTEKITPASALTDLEGILAQHYDSPPHMKLHKYPPPHQNEMVEECVHISNYLQLDEYHNLEDGHITALLFPVRGLSQVKRQWEEVDFPWYRVYTEATGATSSPAEVRADQN
jgi:hypothetical protein